jgi:hypothetical protein
MRGRKAGSAAMSKFGKKFTCWKCSTKFYDLNKPGALCPKCGANPEDDPNKGIPIAPAAAFGDDAADVEEDIPDEIPEDEEADEEGEEEAPAAGDDDY